MNNNKVDVSIISRFKAYLNMPELSSNKRIYVQVPICSSPHYNHNWIYSIFLNYDRILMVEISMAPDIYFQEKLSDIPEHLINKIEDQILDKVLYGTN